MTAVIIFVQTTTFRRDPRHRQQKRNSRESAVWCAGIDVMVRDQITLISGFKKSGSSRPHPVKTTGPESVLEVDAIPPLR